MEQSIVDRRLLQDLKCAKYADRDEAVALCLRAGEALVRLEYDYIITRGMLEKLVRGQREERVCPCVFAPVQRGGSGRGGACAS